MRTVRMTALIGMLSSALLAAGCASVSQSAAPGPTTGTSASDNVKRVVFIGDSITGGWGFESDNNPILDNVASLGSCAQDPPPMNACTNDQPGAANKSYDVGVKPWIAYPFQVANAIANSHPDIEVSDYAVSGATPAMWDPMATGLTDAKYQGKSYQNVAYACNHSPQDMSTMSINDPKWDSCDPNLFPGLYATDNNPSLAKWNLSKLPEDSSTLTVFTLGANPLMSRYLGFTLFGYNAAAGADTKIAAQAAKDGNIQPYLDSVKRNIDVFRVVEHLSNTLTYLSTRGPVVVEKIYNACPGLFGNTNNSFSGVTSSSAACVSANMSQLAQAATTMLNQAIDQAVADASRRAPDGKFVAICPGMSGDAQGDCGGPGTFDSHQQTQSTLKYGGKFPDNNPWLISTDTGIHPNAAGHRFLASGVLRAACGSFDLFCDNVDQATGAVKGGSWPKLDKSCRATYYCAFAAVTNNTGQTWHISRMSQKSKSPTESGAGEWILLPPNEVKPGETMRYAIQSRHTGSGVGAKGDVSYQIGNDSGTVKISTEVGLFSNSWKVDASGQYSGEIFADQSKKKGSEEILNGQVTMK